MGNRLSEVGKDITELKTLSGSGVEVVRGELDERLNKAEKRVVDIEEAFAGLKERLEEVGTQLLLGPLGYWVLLGPFGYCLT